MRISWFLVTAAAIGLLAPLPFGLRRAEADGLTSRPDIMPVKDIRRGMKGYGLTVFEGTKPERFEVEVIDVLDNFRPKQELILIKTKHPRLEVAKVVAGMSGSPVYIDGKMIGAYAYGWTFGAEPVAGVTPIRAMLDELVRPLPERIYGWPLRALPKGERPGSRGELGMHGSGGKGANRYGVELGKYDLDQHASLLAERRAQTIPGSDRSALVPVSTPLLIGGMTPGAVGMARQLLGPLGLEPLQAGGGGAPDPKAPTRYVDGGAVGVQLVRGDMSATGLGTVTRVEGDRLVAFGHPMMEAGVTALPTAIGKVLWFLASEQRSFKIGMAVREVGALVNDRQASIVVSHAAQAPVIPVAMRITGMPGLPSSSWSFEVAHEKFMSPSFVAMALGSALQAVASERQDISWTAKSTLSIKGYGKVRLQDYGVAIGGTPEAGEFARSNLVRAVGSVLNNPWEPALIENVSMDVELRYAREILRLRGAELLSSEIDAGEPARIRLTLVPYSGPEVTRVVTVPIPAHLAGQSVSLEIQPGYMEERETAAPDTLAEMIRNFENPVYPAKTLVVSYDTGNAAVSFKGHVAKNLPPGALDALRPTTSTLAPDAFQSAAREVVALPEFMVGRDRVTVKVRPVLR
ncbi:MAG TPA: SpoIVB peptidase S55 domain-containing protein [Polyangiaceae bacterium]|nr:SpoIVB peptidase S55 domain-containing protein [Polyangiaceae bacterium]